MNLLASVSDFLATPGGIAAFVIFDVVVFIAIAALNYRWLFKRAFDVLFSGILLAALSPFFAAFLIAAAVSGRAAGEGSALFEREEFAGKGGRIARSYVFVTERTEEGERQTTAVGRILRGCGMKYYPRLAAVFLGGLSFVGPRPMALEDAEALSPEERARFAVRPGLVSSLERYGGEKLTYPGMLEEDAEYAAHISLAGDISFVLVRLGRLVRGDAARPYGECTEEGYLAWLVRTGAVSEEEAEKIRARAERKRGKEVRARQEMRDYDEMRDRLL